MPIIIQAARKVSWADMITIIILITSNHNFLVQGLVSYPFNNATILATNVAGEVNQIRIIDNNFDARLVIAIGARWRLATVAQRVSFNPLSPYNLPKNFGKYIRGVEAVDFISIKSSASSSFIVVACSNVGLQSTSKPTGALQLFRENADGTQPTVRNLISTTSLQGPTKRMIEVDGRDVKVLDINKDRYRDIIATMSGRTSTEDNVGFLVYLKGLSTGGFKTIILDENLKGKARLDVGDFDQNGFLDIAVLAIDRATLFVYYQEKDGTFSRKMIDDNVQSNMAIATGYFNGDVGPDIVLLGRSTMTVYFSFISLNGASTGIYIRAFTKNALFSFDAAANLENDYRWFQVELYDVNQDGNMDIVFIQGKQANIKWIRQQPKNVYRSPSALISVASPRSFEIGRDMNRDQTPDIVAYSMGHETLSVSYGIDLQ